MHPLSPARRAAALLRASRGPPWHERVATPAAARRVFVHRRIFGLQKWFPRRGAAEFDNAASYAADTDAFPWCFPDCETRHTALACIPPARLRERVAGKVLAAQARMEFAAAENMLFGAGFFKRELPEGAKEAAEVLVAALNSGDPEELRHIAAPSLMDAFAGPMERLQARGERVEITLPAVHGSYVNDVVVVYGPHVDLTTLQPVYNAPGFHSIFRGEDFGLVRRGPLAHVVSSETLEGILDSIADEHHSEGRRIDVGGISLGVTDAKLLVFSGYLYRANSARSFEDIPGFMNIPEFRRMFAQLPELYALFDQVKDLAKGFSFMDLESPTATVLAECELDATVGFKHLRSDGSLLFSDLSRRPMRLLLVSHAVPFDGESQESYEKEGPPMPEWMVADVDNWLQHGMLTEEHFSWMDGRDGDED
ncbi:hypothetical protein DFJ74DRAFT_689432 [Hyaloraphidium curvatum]|nr:hypothetical protein DFJ74DRAFT_689432 [Hyaloraphidium curvatum]